MIHSLTNISRGRVQFQIMQIQEYHKIWKLWINTVRDVFVFR